MWYLVIIVLIPAAILLLSLAMIHLGFRALRIREKRDPDRLGLAHKEELVQFLRDSGFPVYSRAATWRHIAYWWQIHVFVQKHNILYTFCRGAVDVTR